MEQLLREENYQLKNEITDLKNAFDLNRGILKILSTYNTRTDPEHHLLLQIITRLTTFNNQSLLNSIQLIQQKNVLKQEVHSTFSQNLRLNLELKAVEQKLGMEVELNRLCNNPNQSKILMNEQFNSLNRELLAANEERIAKDQEIQYWKQKYAVKILPIQQALAREEESTLQSNHSSFQTTTRSQKIKRKYESNSDFKLQIFLRQAQKENKKLKKYIEELENRLMVLIKAFNIKEDSLVRRKNSREDSFEVEKAEIRLLKYALNSISVQKKHDEYILNITERFQEKDQMNNIYIKDIRSSSWPKNHIPPKEQNEQESDLDLRFRRQIEGRMEQRQY